MCTICEKNKHNPDTTHLRYIWQIDNWMPLKIHSKCYDLICNGVNISFWNVSLVVWKCVSVRQRQTSIICRIIKWMYNGHSITIFVFHYIVCIVSELKDWNVHHIYSNWKFDHKPIQWTKRFVFWFSTNYLFFWSNEH